MKKLFQLWLCITVLFTMFACSKPKIDDEAIDRIIPAVQKFAELDSFDYEIGLDAPSAKAKIYGSCLLDKLQLSLFVDVDAEGMNMEKFLELYIADNMLYTKGLGQKQKQEMNLDKTLKVSFDPDTVNFNKKDLKQHLKAASIKNNTLHFELKDETVKDAVKNGNIDVKELGIEEVSDTMFDIELDNEFIKSVSITFSGLNNGEKTSITAYLKLNNINQMKSLELPKDIEDWPMAKDTSDK